MVYIDLIETKNKILLTIYDNSVKNSIKTQIFIDPKSNFN